MTVPKLAKSTLKVNPNEVLLFWKSPSHPYKKRNKDFFQTVAALVFLVVVILFFGREWLLIGVVLSIVFVVYVLSAVPPLEVEHKITPLGITTVEELFEWQNLAAYWLEERWGQKSLVIHTKLQFPPQVRLMLGSVDQEKLKKVVGKYLPFIDKPPKSGVDKLTEWLGKRIRLDKT